MELISTSANSYPSLPYAFHVGSLPQHSKYFFIYKSSDLSPIWGIFTQFLLILVDVTNRHDKFIINIFLTLALSEIKNMEFTHDFDESSGICTITVTGTVKRPEDSQILQQFAYYFDKDQCCRKFLFDMTEAMITGGTMEAYNTGAFQADTEKKQIWQKMALVYAEVTEEHKFMETVAVNRGYFLRVFNQCDKEDAIRWLTTPMTG